MAEETKVTIVDETADHGDQPDEVSTNELNRQGLKDQQVDNKTTVLSTIQTHMDHLGPSPADFIRSLPKAVRRRIKALKKLQAETHKIESQFFEEVHQIECKYAAQYEPITQKRHDIVTGVMEPTDVDCEWPSDEEDDDEDLSATLTSKAKICDAPKEGEEKEIDNVKGVPEFWLTIFKNVDMLAEMIQEHDEPILKHLQDIKLHLTPDTGFTLEFVFSANEYFSNTSLTKAYTYRFSVDEENILGYEGPEILKCVGCTIDWQKGKNVTVKLVKKVQKHKGRGTKRTITKTIKADSFFNFFDPPTVTDEEETDDMTELLQADYEIGHFLREHIVPRAVLYYTGEAIEEDDGDYDDGEGEDENEGEDDDDDDDVQIKNQNHAAIIPKGKAVQGKPENCNQQ